MTRSVIAGALYGDHLHSGEFCALVPHSHVQTHLGSVGLPPGETFGPCFPRCTIVEGFRFAGQAHDTTDPACWEYDAGVWTAFAPPCCGVSPLIYKLDGFLLRSDCGPGVGSQGYRYVNAQDVAITGDATYGPFHGLFEYTELGDNLWIGQAAYDGGGVQVWDGATLRQLELGDCRFVRANRDGDTVALAYSKPEGVILVTTTMADLRALPVVVPPTNPIPVPPIPPEPPVSQPLPANVKAIRDRFVAAFPVPQINSGESQDVFEDRCREWCRQLAEQVHYDTRDARYGTKKSSANNPPSKDSLAFAAPPLISWDLLSGVGTGHPTLVPDPQSLDIPDQVFIAVPPINHLEETPVPPTPPGQLPPGVYPITYPPGYVPPKDLNDWIHVEFPKLAAAYKSTHGGNDPHYEWAAFQTCRRYGAGLPQGEPAWTFEAMLKHELSQ